MITPVAMATIVEVSLEEWDAVNNPTGLLSTLRAAVSTRSTATMSSRKVLPGSLGVAKWSCDSLDGAKWSKGELAGESASFPTRASSIDTGQVEKEMTIQLTEGQKAFQMEAELARIRMARRKPQKYRLKAIREEKVSNVDSKGMGTLHFSPFIHNSPTQLGNLGDAGTQPFTKGSSKKSPVVGSAGLGASKLGGCGFSTFQVDLQATSSQEGSGSQTLQPAAVMGNGLDLNDCLRKISEDWDTVPTTSSTDTIRTFHIAREAKTGAFILRLISKQEIRDENYPRPGRCEICLETYLVWMRMCCHVKICQGCLETYVEYNMGDGVAVIQCPGHDCGTSITPGITKGAIDSIRARKSGGGGISTLKGAGQSTCSPDCFSYDWLIRLLDSDDWYVVFVGSIPLSLGQCATCLDANLVWTRKCCKVKICQACLKIYVGGKIDDGVIDIQCPGHTCDTQLPPDIIKGAVDTTKAKRFSFLCVRSGRCKYKKACPMCDKVVTLDDAYLNFFDTLESIIVCPNPKCLKEWCFQCVVPWHEGYTCAEFKSFKTDTGVDKWAERTQTFCSERNAQQCPSCKMWIQKIEGCYMMTCKGCKTNFCYTCGAGTPHPIGSKCVKSRTGENPAPAHRPAPRPAAPRHAAQRPAANRPAANRPAIGRVGPIDHFEIQDPERAGVPGRRHRNGLSAKLVAIFTTTKCNIMWFRCAIVFVIAFICAIGIISHGFLEAFVRPYNN